MRWSVSRRDGGMARRGARRRRGRVAPPPAASRHEEREDREKARRSRASLKSVGRGGRRVMSAASAWSPGGRCRRLRRSPPVGHRRRSGYGAGGRPYRSCPPSASAASRLALRLSCESNPLSGGATYGNEVRNGTSFWSTPSPSGSLLPFRKPPMTRSSMSTTSSASRRPFGNPACRRPMHAEAVRRGVRGHAEVDLQRVGRRRVRARSASGPGCPSAAPATMSVRSVSGTFRPGNRTLMTFASSGLTTYLPKFLASSRRLRRVEHVLLARAG